MAVDWRALFDSVSVPWRDRGKNTKAGNINICCPLCRDDPGFHLSLSESKAAYYCYRQPEHHSGSDPTRVLLALGFGRREAIQLQNRYNTQSERKDAPAEVAAPSPDVQALWDRFSLLANTLRPNAFASYMQERGFGFSQDTVRRYDLRFAREGTWAARVLLPCRIDGQVASWTGRAIRDGIEPKYLNEATGERGNGLIYVPDPELFKVRGCVGIIVEGPLDALKIASANLPWVAPVALMGKALPPAKLANLASLLRRCLDVYVAMDSDTGTYECMSAMNQFGQMGLGITAPIRRLRLPAGYKDACEMDQHGIIAWLIEGCGA